MTEGEDGDIIGEEVKEESILFGVDDEVVELCLNLEKLRLEVAKRAWRKKLVHGLALVSLTVFGGCGEGGWTTS